MNDPVRHERVLAFWATRPFKRIDYLRALRMWTQELKCCGTCPS